MKKASYALGLSLLSLACGAFAAASPTSEIRESTDPAKISEIEQHAAELQARQERNAGEQASGESGTEGARKAGSHGHMKKHGTKSHRAKPKTESSGVSPAEQGSDSGSK